MSLSSLEALVHVGFESSAEALDPVVSVGGIIMLPRSGTDVKKQQYKERLFHSSPSQEEMMCVVSL